MDKYLDGDRPDAERDHARPSAGARSQLKIVPVLCGSAFKNKGVQPLLDAVVDYLPSPLDVPPVDGDRPATTATDRRRTADDDEPFAALAFKIMTDSVRGTADFLPGLFRRR
ncbi:MAG: hypothetical protein MZU95_06060 [Desulfomicrobium escambiense]|nr:hypothetical protein [Desulfomicrobium escambiense]